jgi:UDP-N-acetylglucosamine transferase subunit ALG13
VSAILVASSGGHLKEMFELRRRLPLSEPVRWVTFAGEQSDWLLAREQVDHVHYTAPRDINNVLRNVPAAIRILRRHRPEEVISTGSAIALSFLPVARALGARCHYIESAARDSEPSVSGRLLEHVPGIQLYSQHPSWDGPRWRFGGSVFDTFEASERDLGTPTGQVSIRRVVVTVGTMPFGFRRLVMKLVQLLGSDVEVLWQTGRTDVHDLAIQGRRAVPTPELERAMADADLVVAHAGIGSALEALEAGRCPLLVPRSRAAGEHVDDHQVLIASELHERGLAVSATVDALDDTHLIDAARRVIMRRASPPLFKLRL